MQALRQKQGRLSKIQDLSDLFQDLGQRGQSTGSKEGQLVMLFTITRLKSP
jgi:hypothetical protein